MSFLLFNNPSPSGHFTYECRNFVKLDQEKAVVLDISSCSSDSEEEDDTPLNVGTLISN